MGAATIWTGILQIATVLLILALLYRPLGDWIADLAGALIGASVYAIVRPSDPAVADESASG